MKEVNGFWWPDTEAICMDLLPREVGYLDTAMGLCKQKRTAIQAGGNVGVYPIKLSAHFTSVFTFEPNRQVHECFARNAYGADNIYMSGLALGDRAGELGIELSDKNCGGGFIRKGSGVYIVTIDSLNLRDVDLIQLDIEGFESYALHGASDTIARCSPVIMLEDKGHSDRYSRGCPVEYLKAFGYTVAHRIMDDVVLVPEGHSA